MIHFEGVNTWDVNIYLYYRMNVRPISHYNISLWSLFKKERGRSCRVHVFISKGYNIILLFICLLRQS